MPACKRKKREPFPVLPNPLSGACSDLPLLLLIRTQCFWLGVLDLVLMYALKERLGVWVVSIAIIDGLLGYFFAYLFYFLFAMHDDVIWMCRGLIVIFLYVCGTAFLTFEALSDPRSHVEFSEGLVNGLKAFANLVVFCHGVSIMNATKEAQKKAANPPTAGTRAAQAEGGKASMV